LIRRYLFLLIGPLFVLGLACNAGSPAPSKPTPPATGLLATPSPSMPPPPSPTASPLPPDSGWQEIRAGLDHRVRRWYDTAGQTVETMHILRLDPAAFAFRVAYAPHEPLSVREWADRTGAMITVNAGYFTPEYVATGLLVADGVAHGTSYRGFGGMVAVGPAGVEVRSLEAQPYDPTEPLAAAVQSFPLLIKPGATLGFPDDDGIPSRRTIIGQDRAGRILIIACPGGTFTLHRLALELLKSDLDLDVALNLDGGSSTGLWVTAGEAHIKVPSLLPVPAVLLIDPRE
jgi:uncharacterized protein YigE (DUF2233 family)